MDFFEAAPVEGYEVINCVDPADYDAFLELNTGATTRGWGPPLVRRLGPEIGQPGLESDFPWFGVDVLVMRRHAVDALRDLLEANGEVLPLATEDGVALSAYKPQVIDALDETRSTIARIPGTNKIMRIRRAVFIPSVLSGVDLFTLPHRASATYLSDRVVTRIKFARLRGITFEKVWSG